MPALGRLWSPGPSTPPGDQAPLGLAKRLLPWLSVWLLALAARYFYLWQIYDSDLFRMLQGDARAYDDWAQTIAAGNWLGVEVFYQAPLYPYFLGVLYSIAGHDLLLVRLVQMALGATSCLLLARAGRQFFGAPQGLLAGMLLAINPAAIYYDGLVQKTSLDLFLLTLLLWALGHAANRSEKLRWWFCAGA